MCFKTINYNDVYCGWVGGMQARFDNLLAKASIIQNYNIFSIYTCRLVLLKFHVEIHFLMNTTHVKLNYLMLFQLK